MKLFDMAIPLLVIYVLLITISLATEGCIFKAKDLELIAEETIHAQK